MFSSCQFLIKLLRKLCNSLQHRYKTPHRSLLTLYKFHKYHNRDGMYQASKWEVGEKIIDFYTGTSMVSFSYSMLLHLTVNRCSVVSNIMGIDCYDSTSGLGNWRLHISITSCYGSCYGFIFTCTYKMERSLMKSQSHFHVF